jgi:hypothetical protein
MYHTVNCGNWELKAEHKSGFMSAEWGASGASALYRDATFASLKIEILFYANVSDALAKAFQE